MKICGLLLYAYIHRMTTDGQRAETNAPKGSLNNVNTDGTTPAIVFFFTKFGDKTTLAVYRKCFYVGTTSSRNIRQISDAGNTVHTLRRIRRRREKN